jgi:hypothetical protein
MVTFPSRLTTKEYSMKSLIAFFALFSTVAFAGVMGPEAVEMAEVLTHPQVKECLANVDLGQMINLQIEKKVARCPMCNTYVITGNGIVEGDIIVPEKTEISIVGKGVPGWAGGFIQTWRCEVKQK